MRKNLHSWRVLFGWLAALILLSGCAGAFRLHDESKAQMAAGIKEQYVQADVLGVIDIEKNNLDNLLAEELKVVRDNHRLQVDFALLRIADDNAPMAETYTKKARERLRELGYPVGFKELRLALYANVDLTVGQRELQEHRELLMQLTGALPPPCRLGDLLPETMDLPEALAVDTRAGAENFYRLYRAACRRVQEKSAMQPRRGLTKKAFDEWQAAQDENAKLDQTLGEAERNAGAKKAAYDEALAQLTKAKDSGAKLQEELTQKAALLKIDFEVANEIANTIAKKNAAMESADAIIVLLTAAATGEINTADPQLMKAAIIAKEIPSLAGDVKALVEQARVPSVNNLLIELRHQVVLLEYAKQLKTLTELRADILKTKYDALLEEAGFWLRFGDAVCSYAMLSGARKFPGQACDDFSVKSGTGNWTCSVPDITPVENCSLGKHWNENIQSPGNSEATRELYKALAAYLQALAVQATQHDQTYRLIDVRHRETLASRASALRGWDNLVSVPVDQLEAYYQAGLKPAEIADLIVKALGFTAIAVGVSQ